MKAELIFLPILAHILLVIWLYLRLAMSKSQAVDSGQVDEGRRALDEDAWPDNVRKINNNIRNQFEAPILFYTLSLVIYHLDAVSPGILTACAVFVLTRFFHSWVHTGSNAVPTRRALFIAGLFILMGLTIYALATITLGPENKFI